MNVTRWRPDTCGCVVEYSWDPAVDPAFRVHTPQTFDASACTVHGALGLTLAQGHSRLNDENPRKNKIHQRAVTWAAANRPDLLNADGGSFKEGNFLFSYDATGLLTVTFPNLTAGQKAQLQAAADSLVGANKILVR